MPKNIADRCTDFMMNRATKMRKITEEVELVCPQGSISEMIIEEWFDTMALQDVLPGTGPRRRQRYSSLGNFPEGYRMEVAESLDWANTNKLSYNNDNTTRKCSSYQVRTHGSR